MTRAKFLATIFAAILGYSGVRNWTIKKKKHPYAVGYKGSSEDAGYFYAPYIPD